MTLSKPLAFLDIESTGLDPQSDRILELAILTFNGSEVTFERTRRFNPGVPIPPASTEIHGITDADVEHELPLSAPIGRGILTVLEGCDLAGYNLRRFDLPILDEELRRVGLRLDLAGVRVLDVFGIFAKKEARSLSDAVRKYCGREHDGAHGAAADNRATLDVLMGQLQAYPDLAALEIDKLAEFSQMSEFTPADIAGKLGLDKDGDCVYLFGKYKGMKVRDEESFADWMLNRANFPGSTCEALRAELDRIYKQETS